ncbi:hypothetical protein [Clostridium sp.]|uniref:hypothetical protein n=1 Tax=Clostridium sp. TaxID=1506 RepID=UPI0025BA9B8E|nr:hypothetical protein [Clostridium sp.]
MSPDNIKGYIEIIPMLFLYIVPGYLFFRVFNFVLNKKNEKLTQNIVEYIICSYVIMAIVRFILGLFFNEVVIELPEVIVSILLLSGILGYVGSRLILSDWFSGKILNKLNITRTINNNIFEEYFNDKKGLWVKIYLKDDKLVYYGAIVGFDVKEKYEDGYIIINQYEVYKYDKSTIYDSTLDIKCKVNNLAFIKVANISRIEARYSEDSKLLCKILNNSQKYT